MRGIHAQVMQHLGGAGWQGRELLREGERRERGTGPTDVARSARWPSPAVGCTGKPSPSARAQLPTCTTSASVMNPRPSWSKKSKAARSRVSGQVLFL